MFPLNTAGRIGLNVALLLAGVVALHFGEPVFVPLLISLLLASVLGPAALWLHQHLKLQWFWACFTAVSCLVIANILVVAIFSGSVMRLVNQLSDPKRALVVYQDFRERLEKVSPFELDSELLPDKPENIDKIGVLKYLREAVPSILQQTGKYTLVWSTEAIIILVITFFLLLEGRMLARRAVAIFGPSEEVQAKATEVLFEMANQVRTYLVWRTLINLILAIVMGTVYQTAGLSQAWTWAVLLAILNYIPYLGPVLACVPPFVDAFIFANPAAAVVIFVVFWVVISIEGYIVVPMVMGRNMDLNATTVMLACLFWDAIWGPTGLFLAMPIMAGIKAILYNVPEWRPWANLMSSTEDPVPIRPPMPAVDPPPNLETPNGKAGTPHGNGQLPAEGEKQRAEDQPQ
jgi:predicted PurR-regulated permease PerM